LSAWREWSEKSGKFQEGECAQKWPGFARGEGAKRLGVGTLFMWAKEDGWAWPPLPEILITTAMKEVNDQAVAALENCPDLYQRGEGLVGVACTAAGEKQPEHISRAAGAPHVLAIEKGTLHEEMSAAARWLKWNARQKDWVPAIPPEWSVKGVYE